jgi:nucleotide-binding universal stress UspA family protein
MIELKRILLPTDFSENSQQATIYACALAEQFGSELHVLHVVQDIVAMVPEPGLACPAGGDYLREADESARAALAIIPDASWSAGRTIVRATRQGPPFVEIIRYAKDQAIDLIVLGTHGRGGLAHVLMGSVAERVVRKAPCPVLTVRPRGHQFVMP